VLLNHNIKAKTAGCAKTFLIKAHSNLLVTSEICQKGNYSHRTRNMLITKVIAAFTPSLHHGNSAPKWMKENMIERKINNKMKIMFNSYRIDL
jgi:hypothetical protein